MGSPATPNLQPTKVMKLTSYTFPAHSLLVRILPSLLPTIQQLLVLPKYSSPVIHKPEAGKADKNSSSQSSHPFTVPQSLQIIYFGLHSQINCQKIDSVASSSGKCPIPKNKLHDCIHTHIHAHLIRGWTWCDFHIIHNTAMIHCIFQVFLIHWIYF